MKAGDILKQHQLKRTSCREGILDVLIAATCPISENEIRERLVGNYDRTTFYRSFKTMEECKIVHKIVVDNQVVRYALSNGITQKDEHVHFYCNTCHSVKCLTEVAVVESPLPEGYQVEDQEVIIKGICPDCKS